MGRPSHLGEELALRSTLGSHLRLVACFWAWGLLVHTKLGKTETSIPSSYESANHLLLRSWLERRDCKPRAPA